MHILYTPGPDIIKVVYQWFKLINRISSIQPTVEVHKGSARRNSG